MSQKLSIIIASAIIGAVIGINVYITQKVISYVNGQAMAVKIEQAERELYRLQEESHFLYQVCRDQSYERGESAKECFKIAIYGKEI